MAITQQEAADTLRKFVDAYDATDPTFFDFFAPDASFFTISSVTRIDSLEEYRRGFEPFFTAGTKRRSQINSPEFQVVGDTAIVTFHSRIFLDSRVTNLRETMAMTKDATGKIKIAHYHSSLLQTPTFVPPAGATPETIDLLEERSLLAPVTAGTPK